MKKLLRTALVAAAAICAAPAIAAEPPPAPKIAVVDLNLLSQKSLVTHDLEKKVDAARATFRENTKYKFEALQEELRALRVDSANITPEERDQRQKSLEGRITQLADENKQGMDAIEARGHAAMDSLQPRLQAIIKRVAEGMSLDLVLDKPTYDQLVADKLAQPGANDITGLVTTFVNAEIPTVELPAEGGVKP